MDIFDIGKTFSFISAKKKYSVLVGERYSQHSWSKLSLRLFMVKGNVFTSRDLC